MKLELVLNIMKAEYDVIRQDHRLAIKYITGSVSFVSTILTLLFAYAYEKKIDTAFIVLPYIILLYYAFVYSQRYSCLVLSTYCANLEKRICAFIDFNGLNWESSGLSQKFYSGWRIKDQKSNKSIFSAYAFFNFILISVGFIILIFSTFKGYKYLISVSNGVYASIYLISVLVLALVTSFLAIYTEVVFPVFAKNVVNNTLPVNHRDNGS